MAAVLTESDMLKNRASCTTRLAHSCSPRTLTFFVYNDQCNSTNLHMYNDPLTRTNLNVVTGVVLFYGIQHTLRNRHLENWFSENEDCPRPRSCYH